MIRWTIAVSVLALSVGLVGCGDDDSGANPDSAVITLVDATPPDASLPDAFACVETSTIKECGAGMEGCVNITTNNQHCGGCGLACASGGQACVAGPAGDADAGGNDVAHCECPPPFVPDPVVPLDLGIPAINDTGMGGILLGIAPFSGAGFTLDILAVTFNLTTDPPVDTDIDLSAVTGLSPGVAAGFNIDINTQQAQAAFLATSGTLHLTYRCATGIAGTLTNATFEEVEGLMNPTPVAGGCSFDVASTSFAIGDDCGTGTADAGVPDATP